MRNAVLVLLACFVLAGCRHKAAVAVPLTISADELYRRGLAAFTEATPEGYLRASNAFRQAYLMAPTRCEFSLHLAQSLLFLAEEHRLNLEPSEPGRREAKEVVDAVR